VSEVQSTIFCRNKPGEHVQKIINRIHFRDWPDHCAIDVYQLAQLITELEKIKTQPMLIHMNSMSCFTNMQTSY